MRFWKMHGLGNDYIIVDNRTGIVDAKEASQLAKKLCERKFSIGADGMLLLYISNIADVTMKIFNSDGSEAEMCGNGIRCLAKYCYENNIVKKDELTVETLTGVKRIWQTVVEGEVSMVKVNMGTPILERSDIPMLGQGNCINENLEIDGEKFKVTCLSMGNPHCIIFVKDVTSFPVQSIGPKIEKHKLFPKRTNVEFVQVLSKNELNLRVWERGCGETFGCGTGACASVVAGNLINKMGSRSLVHLRGGDLKIEFCGDVFMTGPAEKVFEGEFFEAEK